jgi:hypothetical protein
LHNENGDPLMPYPSYNFLPGVVVNILDGGLASAFAPQDDAILIIGTAGQGVVNTPFQVTDRSVAAGEFGFAGSLEKAIEETATYSDNIIAFRMGTTPMVLSGVGINTSTGSPTPGFNITFGTVESDAASQYAIWYAEGVLAVYLNGEIVYSNQTGAAVDTSDISLSATATGNTGFSIGSGSVPTLSGAILVSAIANLTPTQYNPLPTITTQPVDGTTLTGRQLYIALREAMDLLTGIVVKIVYAPDAVFDQPSVPFYVASDVNTVQHNPATNPNALDWLLVTQDQYNNNIYQWASETANSAGTTVAAYGGLTFNQTGALPTAIHGSTTSAGSTLVLTAVNTADTLTGVLVFKQNTAGASVTVTLSNSTLTAAAAAITTALSTASVTGVTVTHSNNVITITGAVDTGTSPDISGYNTFIVVSNSVQDIQPSSPGFSSAIVRQTAGFMEVSFGSTLANFAQNLSRIGPLVVSVIGTSGPVSVSLTNTRKWIGFLPTYNASNEPVTYGLGLLGNPYLTGTTSIKLNTLCADYNNGFRLPGIYVTADGSYDGTIEVDPNGNPIDAGAHLHVVADYAFLSNGWAANYVTNISGIVTGLLSSLDATTGLTNYQLKATQIWQPTPVQQDALTEAKISVLKYKGIGAQPALLHDLTAATDASDYTNFVRVRCMGVVIQQLLTRANNYIGSSSLNGLTLTAMLTQLNQDLVNLTTRGYCNHSNVTVSSTSAQQKIGHATLTLTCSPADELIQITANVGIGS